MDPLAEKDYSISPYAYCANNPVNMIDPNGMETYTTHDPDEIKDFLNELKANYGDDEEQKEKENDEDNKKQEYYPRKVEVFVWDKVQGKDVGHTAIRIGNEVYGYYPTDENGDGRFGYKELLKSKGEMHVMSIREFNESYKGSKITAYKLQGTKEQYNNLIKNLNGVVENPGNYSLLNRNCTSIAMQMLTNSGYEIGLKYNGENISRLVAPRDLSWVLKWNYQHNNGVSGIYRINLK